MGFTAVSDVPSPLRGVLSRKAPHLPAALATGQHHLLDYGGCHLSSLSLTVKDSPVAPDKVTGGLAVVEKQLAGLAGFFK